MDKLLVTIKYKTANGSEICVEVSTPVKELLEQSTRQIQSQRRQDRRYLDYTDFIDGLTDTAMRYSVVNDPADLLMKMESYRQLHIAMGKLSEAQRRRCNVIGRRIHGTHKKQENKSHRFPIPVQCNTLEARSIHPFIQRRFEPWQGREQQRHQSKKDGIITHNDYRHMGEDYERQNEAIMEVIANLKKERDELENGIDVENPFLATLRKYENIDKLTREILIELGDHIKIYEGGDISIRFKFADELRRIIEYIEVNSHLQVV